MPSVKATPRWRQLLAASAMRTTQTSPHRRDRKIALADTLATMRHAMGRAAGATPGTTGDRLTGSLDGRVHGTLVREALGLARPDRSLAFVRSCDSISRSASFCRCRACTGHKRRGSCVLRSARTGRIAAALKHRAMANVRACSVCRTASATGYLACGRSHARRSCHAARHSAPANVACSTPRCCSALVVLNNRSDDAPEGLTLGSYGVTVAAATNVGSVCLSCCSAADRRRPHRGRSRWCRRCARARLLRSPIHRPPSARCAHTRSLPHRTLPLPPAPSCPAYLSLSLSVCVCL